MKDLLSMSNPDINKWVAEFQSGLKDKDDPAEAMIKFVDLFLDSYTGFDAEELKRAWDQPWNKKLVRELFKKRKS